MTPSQTTLPVVHSDLLAGLIEGLAAALDGGATLSRCRSTNSRPSAPALRPCRALRAPSRPASAASPRRSPARRAARRPRRQPRRARTPRAPCRRISVVRHDAPPRLRSEDADAHPQIFLRILADVRKQVPQLGDCPVHVLIKLPDRAAAGRPCPGPHSARRRPRSTRAGHADSAGRRARWSVSSLPTVPSPLLSRPVVCSRFVMVPRERSAHRLVVQEPAERALAAVDARGHLPGGSRATP